MARCTAKFKIVLDQRKQRHHFFRRPAGAAIGRPFVERGGDAADRDLAVHHRGTTEALAAPVEARLLPGDPTRQQMRPLPLLLIFAMMDDRDRIGGANLPRCLIGAPVQSGFQQQGGEFAGG